MQQAFFNIGPTELLIIFALALLIFGPKKLPELGKSIGRGIRNFKKGMNEIDGDSEEVNVSENVDTLEDKTHDPQKAKSKEPQSNKHKS